MSDPDAAADGDADAGTPTTTSREPTDGPADGVNSESAGDHLSAEEVRVLGCLVEKASTTPDNYPLTLNALRTACNQSTSRDPVVEYTDHDVEVALRSLRDRGLTRTVHSTSNRAAKYRHVLPDVFRLDDAATAVLAVLMLRGPQTVGELKSRTDRLHHFDSVDDVATTLDDLAGRAEPLVHRLAREPGQKDHRWEHLLGPAGEPTAAEDEPAEQPDHLVTVFDQDRLRIELGRRPDSDLADLRVTVRAQHLGGTITDTLLAADLERFVADLEDDAVVRHRLGGGRAVLVELAAGPEHGVGQSLDVECSVVRTEDDPQEWLQFTMVGVPAYAAATAARVRSVLAAFDEAGSSLAARVAADDD